MIRMGGDILNLKPEGNTFENIKMAYLYNDTPISYDGDQSVPLQWAPAPKSNVEYYESG